RAGPVTTRTMGGVASCAPRKRGRGKGSFTGWDVGGDVEHVDVLGQAARRAGPAAALDGIGTRSAGAHVEHGGFQEGLGADGDDSDRGASAAGSAGSACSATFAGGAVGGGLHALVAPAPRASGATRLARAARGRMPSGAA